MSGGWRAPLVNALLGAAPVKWVMEKVLGISRLRTMPRFAARPFTRWFANHAEARGQADGTQGAAASERSVVLFNDTFNTYNDPEVAIAATEVLDGDWSVLSLMAGPEGEGFERALQDSWIEQATMATFLDSNSARRA